MKRPWGTGSVAREGDGFRARLPLSMGRRDVGWFADEAEAHATLTAALELEAERPSVRRTVNDVVAAWLAARDVRENTRAADRGRWATYGERTLGTEDAHGLTAGDVERWWAAVRKAHPTLAFTTLSNLATVVRGALPVAAGAALTFPKRAKKLPDWLREHEIARVLGCQAVPLRSRLIYAIRIYTGLRPGELWGLRWEDVDLARGVLHVRRSRLEATKTSAEREVSLLWPARCALETWRETATPTRSGLVFPSPTTDTVYTDGYDAGWYEQRRLFRLGRRFAFYDLRHTCASHLLQGTWAPRYVERAFRLEEVQDVLGHEDIATTQIYAHLCADSRHALVRDCPEELPELAATPGIRTPDLRFTKASADPQRLRVIQGEAADPGSSPGSVARRVLSTIADGGEVAVMDVVRVCSAVLDHEAAPVAHRERSGR